MIQWYTQVFYALVVFILIQIFKFYFLGNEDFFLIIIRYFRGKNDPK